VHDREIVGLDEPEPGLDRQSRVNVREYNQQLARTKTVILTTHNMDEAERLADRVAIIDHGQLLVVDTPEALKRRVGEGDVIEIGLTSQPGEAVIGQAQMALQSIAEGVVYSKAHALLTVRALNGVGRLPVVLNTLETAGLHVGDVRLRENTLEDVFIELTGRRLRE